VSLREVDRVEGSGGSESGEEVSEGKVSGSMFLCSVLTLQVLCSGSPVLSAPALCSMFCVPVGMSPALCLCSVSVSVPSSSVSVLCVLSLQCCVALNAVCLGPTVLTV
jgi:hypothetical protein